MEKSKMKIDRKPELEFVEYKTFEAVPSKTVEGASQRIIAQIPDTNVATRILELEAGTDTSRKYFRDTENICLSNGHVT